MKKYQTLSKLIEDGKDCFEKTNEFQRKKEQIRTDMTMNYEPLLAAAKNWAGRMMTLIRRELEIRRRISELSSFKNLHLAHGWLRD